MSRRKKKDSPATSFIIILLLAVVIVLGASLWRMYPAYRQSHSKPSPTVVIPEHRETRVSTRAVKPIIASIYYSRIQDGQVRMVAVRREVSAKSPAKAALDELMSGPLPEECDRPLPRGTKLNRVVVNDGIATVDFTEELVSGFRGGSDNEGVTVYAIVNTLASLPRIEKVQILVAGQRRDSIGGHLDISGPLAADNELVVADSDNG